MSPGANREIVRHLESIEAEWHRLGSVWGEQIGNARRHMEVASVSLTGEFAEIVSGLDNLVSLMREFQQSASQASQPALGETLEDPAERLEQEALRLRGSVETALVHMQFQDRVNQILGHVQDNIHALPDALARIRDTYVNTGHLTPLDFTPLLDAIAASYTTLEERASHDGRDADAADELTFF